MRRSAKYLFCTATLSIVLTSFVSAQSSLTISAVRATPAYSEVLLRKTELSAEVEALAADYTDESPKIIDLKYEIASLEKAILTIFAVKASDTGKLTLALGKLMVKRASLDTELQRLSRNYSPGHTEVRRVKKKLEIFDAAIREILP